MFRILRIAFSVTCGIACLLAVALWVRSYSRYDHFSYGRSRGPSYLFGSSNGELSAARLSRQGSSVSPGWDAWTTPADGKRAWSTSKLSELIGFRFKCFPKGTILTVIPQWLIVSLTAATAAAPWIRSSNRFSLRTLLIAMTIIAVGLGLLIAINR